MTVNAIEASSAMFVTSIAVAIVTTTTPDHAGVRAVERIVPKLREAEKHQRS